MKRKAGLREADSPVPNAIPPAKSVGSDSFEDKSGDIYAALKAILGEPYGPGATEWGIQATFEDAVIVRVAGELMRYPVSFDANGAATLGDPKPAEIVYQTVSEAKTGSILGPLVPFKEATAETVGREWACILIQEGLSGNRRLYTADALRGAAPLFEGAQVFWNHDQTGSMRDPRDLAGFVRAPKFGLLEGGKAPSVVMGTFVATDPKARTLLREAFEAGKPDLFGLSIHAGGKGEIVRHTDGRPAHRVDSIDSVESVDIVSKPAAGGRFLRLVAGLPATPVTEEDFLMLEKKIKKLLEARPDLHAKLSATPTESEVDALLLEAVLPKSDSAPAATVAPAAAATPPAAPAAPELPADVKSLLLEARVDRMLKGRTLPEPMAEPTRQTMIALFEAGSSEATVKAFLDGQVTAATKLTEAGVRGAGQRDISVGHDEADKLQKAWHGFFEGKDVDGVARFTSLRQAYIDTTGDQRVTGLLKEAKGLGRFSQMFEGLQSGTLANVLASSLNRQLVQNYNAQGGAYSDDGRGWLYRVVPANDFRNRERVRFGGYGNLATVAEGNPYPTMASPSDEKATYAVTKKGGTETITFEMIRNDDVGAVQEIPRRMAFAARRTYYEFVHNLYAVNPTIYDSLALFHASHGGNLGASALAAAAFSAARLLMLKQTEKDSAKRVGLVLRHLMVPVDLAETAYNLFIRNTNLDEQFIQTNNIAPAIHVITHLTDTNDWFACAGIDQSPQIEVGFLDGREDPEIFVADIPNGGSLFSADKIDYKIRHIYNGAVLDFRPFFGAFGI